MKSGLNGYRIAILAGFGLVIVLLTFMVSNLMSQLRDLSTAAGDNTQWSISQLDTEFANLNATLTEQLAEGGLSENQVQLRVDIVLSRLAIMSSGRAGVLFGENPEARALIDPLVAFSDRAIAISDQPGPLTLSDLRMLRDMARDVRPNVRKISLLGVALGAERSQQRRALFAAQLTRTGGMAIALLVMMAGLMVLLDRMLRRAARRDSELLTSSKQLASTVAASLDAIITANNTGTIIGYNAAAQEVFGWSSDEIIGQTMEATIIPTHLRQAHHDGIKRYLDTGTPKVVDGGRVELSALRKSGEEFPVELNITSIEDDEGTKFIAYLRDISERKINEQTLIDARDRAERTDKAKSQFLTIMSHEMRTPLNGILGVLDLLKTTKLSPKQQRYAEIATASSEILLEQTNEALDINRIEAGTLQVTPQVFDLHEMVSDLVAVLDPLAREKRLDLSLDFQDAMRVDFYGDSNRIRQILTNLIGNAVKFTDQGHVILTVSGIHGPVVSSLKFAVSDTGDGIAAEYQDQVFEDYVALANGDARQSRGDGLGLSISRKIARQIGGDIALTSDVGQGSTFTLTIPLQRRDNNVSADPEPAAPMTSHPTTRKILVVEDNTVNRKVLGDMLQGMGHEVRVAVNGQDCLDQAQDTVFDIIFMDISMPVMDGISATRRLRADGGVNAQTYIIGLTAHGREEYREDAERAGMDRFHTKPIRLDALRTIVADLHIADPAQHDTVPSDALRELCAGLGAQKVGQIGGRFFDELGEFIHQARDIEHAQPALDLAEAAHKNKGAAALLGLRDVEILLAELEHDARAGAVPDLSARLSAIEQSASDARTRFQTMVSELDRATSTSTAPYSDV